jgi:uncharacterized protein (TIGR03083 family)
MGDADDVLADLKSATRRLLDGMAGLTDEAATQPSLLPGWSRGHVLTHLARNAEGSTRLLTWARTGVPSYEYESAEARAAEIEAGAGRPAEVLIEDVRRTAAALEEAATGIPLQAWRHVVRYTGDLLSAALMPAAAAALPDDELGGQPLDMTGQGRIGDPLQQAGAGALAEQAHRLADRGQRRRDQRTGVHVVETDDSDVGRHPYPGYLQLADGPDRHLVVGADDRIGQLRPGPGQDVAHGELAAHRGEPALERTRQPRPRIIRQSLDQSAAPFARVWGLGRPG